MRCGQCGTELIAGKQFCHACGARVVRTCPQCGSSVAPEFHFCPDCGFRLGEENPSVAAAEPSVVERGDRWARLAQGVPEELAQKIRANTAAIAGERKLVTVLFCDLVGSTAIAERMDPEEYHDLLEQYLALAFGEIYRFDGIVNQLAGDGMMALFGAPIAHEDAPQRAVRAALAIQHALANFNATRQSAAGCELRARIGINTGPVVVGTVGNDLKMDYTAIGDTTNLAARLQALAAPGAILVSAATHRRVRGFFQSRPAGTFEVKGKREPVAAHEVIGLTDAATPMAIAAARGLTPFAGRTGELAQLLACAERLDSHLAQVVAVVGDAGSGKSRLLYEFKRQLAAREEVVFFEAHCSSMAQLQPYAPWISMLRQYFGLAAGETPDCACDKVGQHVRPWDARLDRLYPYLCRLMSVPAGELADLPADELKRATFEAVAELVGRLSQQAPVFILFEDLHWIDEASREMLELAVTRIQSARVMLVVSHRPDYQPAWRTHAAFTQLNLRSLSDNDITAIIRAVAGGVLPSELEQLIRTKAEGNPFFAEEITRALIEEGDLVRDNSHLRLARPAEQIRIPGTVEEVIGARVDRFGPDAKRVLQVAAVFGRQFRGSQLIRVLDSEGINVAAQLEELERRGVIHRKTAMADDEFRFGESLTQEVAYESLLLKERRQLHERIGLLLEAQADDTSAEHSALLAHHFARSDSRDKAIGALLRAARRAEQLPFYPAAADLYRRAWELADAAVRAAQDPDEPLRRVAADAALSLCRMTVIYGSSDEPQSERVAQRGRELAEALADAEAVAGFDTYHGMIVMSGARERFAHGLALVEQGLAVAQGAGLTLAAINISRALAWSYLLEGRLALARETFVRLVSDLERCEHAHQLSDLRLGAHSMRSVVRYFSDDLPQAGSEATETYELAVQASNRTVQSMCAGTLALTHFARAEYAEAKRWADQALEVAQAIGNVAAIRSAAIVALGARLAVGESVAVPRYLDLIEQRLTALGDLALKSHLAIDAYLASGELKRARHLAESAYTHSGGQLRLALCATALGEVMRCLGPAYWQEAARWYDEAIRLAQAIGTRSTLALASIGAGELAREQGDHATAARHGQQALALCREVGLVRYRQRAEQLLAAVGAGSGAEASA
ncbi:MAG: AAA family ATPase [Deltaproteobacteria bacterium]|nr:AAA family ATPase [Deltaproteobacteria bacterium]